MLGGIEAQKVCDVDWDSDSLVTQWWLSFSESLSDEAEEQKPVFVTLWGRQ